MNAYYRHLTLSERESIMILLAQGKKQSEIARQLGRSCSTISRELKGMHSKYIERVRRTAAIKSIGKSAKRYPNYSLLTSK